MEPLYTQLAQLARQHGARRLVLFGSRARGDFGPRSDVDLAVYGMPPERRGAFWAAVEELPTLLELDIVHIMDGMDPVFLQNIEKDGVPLMLTKVEHFCQAVGRLREALDVLAGDPGSTDAEDSAASAQGGVALCYQLGIMGGNEAGTFAPDANATRAEVAVTMVQMARVMGR